MEEKTLNNIIQNNEVRKFLVGKTNKERSEIKCAKICLDYKTNLLNKKNIFEKDDIKIEIVGEIKKIEAKGHVGVEVFAKGWQNGKQCGFGKDGSVEIERFRIFNPPILVPDENGSIVENWKDIDGNTCTRKLNENPEQAIKEVIWDNVKSLGKKTKPENGKIGNTVDTFYPNADDDHGYQYGATWADCRNAATGNYTDGSSTTVFVRSMKDGSASNRHGIFRAFFIFDTSALPDTDNIDSATFDLYAQSIGTTNDLVLTGHTSASNTSIANTDYDAITLDTPTEYATRKANNTFSTSAYASFTLNANGLSAISRTGYTKLCVRSAYDVDNIAPGNSTYYDTSFYESGQTGTSQDPKLVVTHSAGASAFIPQIMMS